MNPDTPQPPQAPDAPAPQGPEDLRWNFVEKSWKVMQTQRDDMWARYIPGFDTLQKVELTKVDGGPDHLTIAFSNLTSVSQNRDKAAALFSKALKRFFEGQGFLVQLGRDSSADKVSFTLGGARRGVQHVRQRTMGEGAKKRSKLACIDVNEADIPAAPAKKVMADAVPKVSQPYADPLTKISERRKLK